MIKKITRLVAIFACISLLLAGCGAPAQVSTNLGETQKCVILVLDGFSASYLKLLGTDSNFAKIAETGTCCLSAKSVFPSQTCTAHASIMTGVSPAVHGIIGNVSLGEDGTSVKNIQPDMVEAPTLFEIAKSAGKKTAMVSGKDDLVTMFSSGCDVGVSNLRSLDYLTEAPVLEDKEDNDEYYQYNLELTDWVFDSLFTVLQTENPDLTLVNVQAADYIGHRFGPDSEEIQNVVKRIDQDLGKLYDAMKKAGMLENTTVVVTADHGMTASSKAIQLNALVAQNFEKASAVIDGRNGYIWLNGEDKDAVESYFQNCEGVSEVIEKGSDRAAELKVNADTEPDLILISEDGYEFLPEPMLYLYQGQHGSLSDSDITIPMVWFGSGIPAGAGLEDVSLLTIAPMVCQMMGLPAGNFEESVPQLIAKQDLSAFS